MFSGQKKPPYPPPGPPYQGSGIPYTTYHTGHHHPTPNYPYIEPCVHDSYSHACYHEHHGYPHPNEFPVNGPMKGSAFVLKDYYPYLFDNSHVRYGNILNLSESVVTRISRRADASCVHLSGTFDLTQGMNKNLILVDHLQKCVGQKCEALQNTFSIIQSPITFRLHFSVLDEAGGLVWQNAVTTTTSDMCFHFTDVRDFFIQSMKSIFVTNIPAMDYAGMYRLQLDKLEVYANVVHTVAHLSENQMNPFYAFAENNNRIVLQHDVISNTHPDETILLETIPIGQVIPFQANLTTRLKLSFTAFFSDLIAVPQTYGIYTSMFEPTGVTLETLKQEVSTLKDSIAMINTTLLQLSDVMNELRKTVSTNTLQIEANQNAIEELRVTVASDGEELSSRLDDLDARVKKLEAIPFATLAYQKDVEFVKSQLTWTKYGELYQVTKPFTASGDMHTEIASGKLVPITSSSTDGSGGSITIDDETIIALTARIDSCETKFDDVTSQFTVISQDLDVAKTDLIDHTTKLEQCISNIKTMETSIQDNETTISQCIDDLTTLTTQTSTIETKVNETVTNLEQLSTRTDELNGTVNVNTESISDINQQLEIIGTKLSEDETKWNTTSTELKDVHEQVTDLQTTVNSHTDQLTAMSQQMETTGTTLADLETKVERNATSVNQLVTAVNETKSNVTTNTEHITTCVNDIQTMQTQIETMSKKLDSVNSDANVEEIRTIAETNATDIATLQQTVDQHATDMTSLTSRVEQVESAKMQLVKQSEYDALTDKTGIYAIIDE